MNKKELNAIAWAVRALRERYDNSQKALGAGRLMLAAQENITQYEVLKNLLEAPPIDDLDDPRLKGQP